MTHETQPIVLGTAGHIDHGKTALVRALTGIDTDRLKVEKERGITTELGFAHLDLEGRRFGFVDVPGHERFIKAMVSGAGGLDLVCLVIAADEGVMPQTREHLDICELLGVRRGVVALSKSDLVDDEWLELVTEEVRESLADSFLGPSNIVPCSAKTGAGLDDLRDELVRLTNDLPARDAAGGFRLPIDRVFTIKGFGTVVTGTILGGTVTVGDTVVAHPSGASGKVRGLQSHGEDVGEVRAGMRCAVNLSGISTDDLDRGDMLAHSDALTPSHILDVSFRYLSTSKAPLKRQSRVLLHHGTAQRMASLVLVNNDSLAPGQESLAQLRLDINEPVLAMPGDRFIARGFVMQDHYGTTIGGGEIIRSQAPKVRRSSAEAAAAVERFATARGDQRIAEEIKGASFAGISLDELGRRLGAAAAHIEAAMKRLGDAGEIIKGGSGSAAVYCHAEPFAMLEKRALDYLDAFHEENPAEEGMSREELRARLPRSMPTKIFEQLIGALTRREAIHAESERVRRTGRGRSAAGPLNKLETTLLERYRDWDILAPKLKEVLRDSGSDDKTTRAALNRLLEEKHLVRVKSDYYVGATAIDALRAKLVAHLDAHGQITPAEWKEITGASRKFSIPLAEYFDAEKLTLRIGDVRKKRG